MNIEGRGKSKRQIKNMLINPHIQLKFAIYSILLSISLVGVLGFVTYNRIGTFTQVLFELTGAEQEVLELLKDYFFDLGISIFIVFLIFLTITLGIYIRMSHRILGPVIAFDHHITALIEGRYQHRTHLRQKDAFKSLADRLNTLSETLENAFQDIPKEDKKAEPNDIQ